MPLEETPAAWHPAARVTSQFRVAATMTAIGGLLTLLLAAPEAAQQPAGESAAARHRATLDAYCVTCHNDRLKTSNLSLERLDLSTVGDHPEIWERVVRKLRAGVMPPPD